MSPTLSTRAALIAKIHIAKKDLGLDDAAYRQALATATRCRVADASTKTMNEGQLTAVLEHFKKHGWQPKATRAAGRQKLASTPMDRKIRALWIKLRQLGALRDPSEKALASYVKHMTGCDTLQFVPDDKKWLVIEVLKKWIERVENGQAVPEYRIETNENGGTPVTGIVEASK